MENYKMTKKHSLSIDWDNIVKTDIYSDTIKRISRADELEQFSDTLVNKPTKTFPTDGTYFGQWDSLGTAGYGLFTFPHGVEYQGFFKDGMFHGKGTLTYPMGQKLEGLWNKGKLKSYKFIFADGLTYSDPWTYCQFPDRRFYVTLKNNLQPAGREFLTDKQPTRIIPESHYDTELGFYNPGTKCVYSAKEPKKAKRKYNEDDEDDENNNKDNIDNDVEDNSNRENDDDDEDDDNNNKNKNDDDEDEYENEFPTRKILSIPTKDEEMWILANCRKAWDEPTCYRPELYEFWTTGKKFDSPLMMEEVPSISHRNSNDTTSDFSSDSNEQIERIYDNFQC